MECGIDNELIMSCNVVVEGTIVVQSPRTVGSLHQVNEKRCGKGVERTEEENRWRERENWDLENCVLPARTDFHSKQYN